MFSGPALNIRSARLTQVQCLFIPSERHRTALHGHVPFCSPMIVVCPEITVAASARRREARWLMSRFHAIDATLSP